MGEQSGKLRTTVGWELPLKSSAPKANNSSALSPLTTSDVIRETQCIVLKYGTARAAEEQGASPRAIENQKNGESAISLRNMLNWCRVNPRVRAEFMALMGCDCETDPDFVQGISLLMNKFVRERTSEASVVSNGGEGALPGRFLPELAGDAPSVAGDLFESDT